MENHWNGSRLDGREGILGFAASMTWNGNQPTVEVQTGRFVRHVLQNRIPYHADHFPVREYIAGGLRMAVVKTEEPFHRSNNIRAIPWSRPPLPRSGRCRFGLLL